MAEEKKKKEQRRNKNKKKQWYRHTGTTKEHESNINEK